MSYQSINPYNGKLLETFAELTNEQLEASITAAATCFDSWRHTTFAHRAGIAAKAAAILRARVDKFAKPITLKMGKLIDQARGEVLLSADIIDYYAKNAEAFLAPQRLQPEPDRHRHGQSSHLDDAGPAIRRNQELRLCL